MEKDNNLPVRSNVPTATELGYEDSSLHAQSLYHARSGEEMLIIIDGTVETHPFTGKAMPTSQEWVYSDNFVNVEEMR